MKLMYCYMYTHCLATCWSNPLLRENEHRGEKTSNGKEGGMKPSEDLGKEEEAVHRWATRDEQP
jgi:hypothetical protein